MKILPDIDFHKIRPLKDTRHKGFEELCVQLFRSTFPAATKFYRVDDAGGDGGVEDIALRADGKKIGLQAKFFDKLGSSQWSQINKSVRTALKSHVRDLVEYRIACPCNRSKDTKSWSNYCEKWQLYAKQLGYTKKLSFVWWGDAELRSVLTRKEHHDKVYYWFGAKNLSPEWLLERFKSTEKLLDTRYTPSRHVRTESEKVLDAFSRADGFVSYFWKLFREVLTAASDAFEIVIEESINEEKRKLAKEIDRFRKIFSEDYGVPPISTCQDCLRQLRDRTLHVYRKYEDLRRAKEDEPSSDDKHHTSRPYSYQLGKLAKLITSLRIAEEFIARFNSYDVQSVLVVGDAGAGKSHLLAMTVATALKKNQPAILVLGEQFLSNEVPLIQLCRILGWEDGVESLLGALNAAASVRGKPAIIAVDALNESGEKKLWKSHLLQAAEQITHYRNLRIIVSCRSDFASFVLPKPLTAGTAHEWSSIEHHGFGEDVFQAVATYFKGYDVACDHFPPVLEEFKNPLFLKTFCEAYANDHVPPGPLSFDQILQKRVKKCQEAILAAIDCPEYKAKNAIDLLASKIAANQGQPIPYDKIRPEIDRLFDGGGESRSLYIHLRSNGIIVETLRYESGKPEEPETVVRFPYERFLDYFVASKLLNSFTSIDDLEAGWRNTGLPDNWTNDHSALYNNRGLLRMLAILVPERFGREFIDLFVAVAIPVDLYQDFLMSLPWRTADTITRRTEELLALCARHLDYPGYLEERLRLIAIPEHPLNARRLHERLRQAKLWERELNWTIVISEMVKWKERSVIDDILRWSFRVPLDLVSDEQAWLAALFLAWLLTSNNRYLRQRASLALTRILIGRTHLAAELIKEFHKCNDPYVVERVYAAACGVALRERDANALGNIALVVYQLMFDGEQVPPNVLQRDFAQLIMEYANYCRALPEGINLDRSRPIYRSKWPKIIPESRARAIEGQKGWAWIKHSLQPEESGFYGDFGRYVMDAEVHHFTCRTLKQSPQVDKGWVKRFNGTIARRYILQRIKQFGWTPKRYDDYEKGISHGRLRADEEKNKIERISKKYQWIGLHELLGYLSDHYRMSKDWSDTERKFEGAWQTYARDFDPTQPLIDPLEQFELVTEEDLAHEENIESWTTYPDPFADFELRFNRERWVMAAPASFESLIEQPNVPNYHGEWLTLSCHYGWEETLTMTQDEKKEGQLKMWTDVRCWIIRKEDKKRFLQMIEGHQFWGHGVDYPQFHEQWLGEYPWASSLKEVVEYCSSADRWIDRLNLDIKMYQTVCGYRNERSDISARLPGPIICELLNLRWASKAFEYINPAGELSAFCPVGEEGKPHFRSPLLVRKEPLLAAIDQAGLTAVWAALCERSCYSAKKRAPIVNKWQITQRLYAFEEGHLRCYSDRAYDIPLGRK